MNEMHIQAAIWLNLESVMLNERSLASSVAPIIPLTQEPPHALGVALKSKKKKKKKKKSLSHKVTSYNSVYVKHPGQTKP